MRALCLACLACLAYLALLSTSAHGPARQPSQGVWSWG
jgi:hypothetical protein